MFACYVFTGIAESSTTSAVEVCNRMLTAYTDLVAHALSTNGLFTVEGKEIDDLVTTGRLNGVFIQSSCNPQVLTICTSILRRCLGLCGYAQSRCR